MSKSLNVRADEYLEGTRESIMRWLRTISMLVIGLVQACALLGVCAPMTAQASMLTNGGAETGDLAGWAASGAQVAAVSQQNQSVGTVLPAEGSFFFTFAATGGTYEELVQTGTAPLTEGTTLILTGMVQTEDLADDDFGVAIINVLDSSDAVIASASSGALASASLTWEPFSVELVVPAGAASWEVRLSGQREYGTFINVFYDSLVLNSGVSSVGELAEPPAMLADNYPNPFNPLTTICFDLPGEMTVGLEVYDVSGRLVDVILAGQVARQGRNEVTWQGRDKNGRQLPSGTYFYRLEAGGYVETKMMTLLK
jgi:hypothetical protein